MTDDEDVERLIRQHRNRKLLGWSYYAGEPSNGVIMKKGRPMTSTERSARAKKKAAERGRG